MLRTQRLEGRSACPFDAWLAPPAFAALLALLIVVAFPDVVFGGGTFFYRDFGIFGYPLAFYHRESFWRGEIPLWNPLNNCGVPFLAQWNTMVLYPPSLFYLLFPLSWSLGVFCLLHLFMAGLGMYFLASAWTGHRLAASVAGLAFAFNGLTLSCLKWPNNISALAWMPWVVWLIERALQRGGRAMLLAAAVGVLQMLTGGPEIVILTWVCVGILWITQLRAQPRRIAELLLRPAFEPPSHELSGPHGPRGRNASERADKNVGVTPFARLMAIVLFVAGLAAAQLLPFLDLLLHSQRGANFSDASWAMPRWGLANLLVPLFRHFPSHQGVFAQTGQYWISSYYCGAGVLALAVFALWNSRIARVRWLALIAAVFILLAMGPEGFLYPWLQRFVPGMQIVRFPIKFIVLAVFVIPWLASFGMATLLANRSIEKSEANSSDPPNSDHDAASKENPHDRSSLKVFIVIGAGLLASIGLILWFARGSPLPTATWPATLRSGITRGLFLVLTVGLASALMRAQRAKARMLCGVLLILLVWLDLITHAPRLNPTVEPWVYEPGLLKPERNFKTEPSLGGPRAMISPYADLRLNHLALAKPADDYLYSRMALFANCNLLEGIPKVDGFFSLYIREENDVRSLLYASTNIDLPKLRGFLGVSQLTAPGKLIDWQAQADFLPLASAGQRPLVADRMTTLRGLADPGFDPHKVVFLNAESRALLPFTNAATARVRVAQFRTHSVELEVDAAQPAWVVLAQTHYHPWHASVNGQETPVWRANHSSQSLPVPAGRSTVRLIYRDSSFYLGVAISLATFVGWVALWLHNRRNRLLNDV